MTPKRTALLLTIMATLAVAGCGTSENDGDRAAFVRDYNAAQEPLFGLVARLNANPVSNLRQADRFASDLALMADEFDGVRARVRRLESPAGAQDEVAGYLDALESGSKELRRVAGAVKERDVKRLDKLVATFQSAVSAVQGAEESLGAAVEDGRDA
jgi:hypothetical protein